MTTKKTTDSSTTETDNESGFDWSSIVDNGGGTAPAARSAPAGAEASAFNNLPPFPQNFAYMVGRLPLSCSVERAVVQLPEAIKGVHCAAVFPNTGVLSDCYADHARTAVPDPIHARPINDREINVFFSGRGEGVVKGLGWSTGDYPGSLPTTRPIGVGQPYVEVLLIIGPDCGCDATEWASDDPWPQ